MTRATVEDGTAGLRRNELVLCRLFVSNEHTLKFKGAFEEAKTLTKQIACLYSKWSGTVPASSWKRSPTSATTPSWRAWVKEGIGRGEEDPWSRARDELQNVMVPNSSRVGICTVFLPRHFARRHVLDAPTCKSSQCDFACVRDVVVLRKRGRRGRGRGRVRVRVRVRVSERERARERAREREYEQCTRRCVFRPVPVESWLPCE